MLDAKAIFQAKRMKMYEQTRTQQLSESVSF